MIDSIICSLQRISMSVCFPRLSCDNWLFCRIVKRVSDYFVLNQSSRTALKRIRLQFKNEAEELLKGRVRIIKFVRYLSFLLGKEIID